MDNRKQSEKTNKLLHRKLKTAINTIPLTKPDRMGGVGNSCAPTVAFPALLLNDTSII